MQIRKLQWINRPKKVKITSSRSLTLESTSRHALVHTFDEDSVFSFKASESPVRIGICIILSPTDGVMLMQREEGLEYVSDILDEHHRAYIPAEGIRSLAAVKNGDTVTFLADGRRCTSFTFPSLKASISVGIILEGSGALSLEISHKPIAEEEA